MSVVLRALACILRYVGGHGHACVGTTQLTLCVEKGQEVGKQGREHPGRELTGLDPLSRRPKVQEAGQASPGAQVARFSCALCAVVH